MKAVKVAHDASERNLPLTPVVNSTVVTQSAQRSLDAIKVSGCHDASFWM
jgi:hypothetical protein